MYQFQNTGPIYAYITSQEQEQDLIQKYDDAILRAMADLTEINIIGSSINALTSSSLEQYQARKNAYQKIHDAIDLVCQANNLINPHIPLLLSSDIEQTHHS